MCFYKMAHISSTFIFKSEIRCELSSTVFSSQAHVKASQRAHDLIALVLREILFPGQCGRVTACGGSTPQACLHQGKSESQPLLSVDLGLCSGRNPFLVGSLSIQPGTIQNRLFCNHLNYYIESQKKRWKPRLAPAPALPHQGQSPNLSQPQTLISEKKLTFCYLKVTGSLGCCSVVCEHALQSTCVLSVHVLL